MTGLGITLTAITLVIIILRLRIEIERKRLSTKGGVIIGLAFALSLAAIVSVSLLTSENSLGIRLFVLAFCAVFVFSSYKFVKRRVPLNKTREIK
jgi:FtsH-binding integral membrane protein